jgi:hypothetical protein
VGDGIRLVVETENAPGWYVNPYALALATAERHGDRLEAEVVNGRVRWWIRPKSGGIFTPQFAPSGVWGKVRETAEHLGVSAQVDARTIEAAIKDLAALLPRRPVSAEPELLTLDALLAMEQTEPAFIVPGFISEGLTVLGGRPKSGKSYLMWDLLTGEKLFDTLPVLLDGGALYLALEDTPRRLAHRLQQFAEKGGVAKDRPVTITTSWAQMSNGGLDALDSWVRDNPKARLVVIDTLGKLRGSEGSAEYNYQADVMMMDPLKQIADRHGIAIVAVSHTRKAEADDPLDTISGTLGIAGTADAAYIFERAGTSARIVGRGRDLMDDLEWGLTQDGVRWRLARPVGDQIRELFKANFGKALSSSEVQQQTGIPIATVKRRLGELVTEGFVIRSGKGPAVRYTYWGGVMAQVTAGGSDQTHHP